MGSSAPELTSKILRRERLIVGASIALLAALGWLFLARGGGMPSGMHAHHMAPPKFAAALAMWWLMMVAMMLPSAAPAVLLYGRVRSSRRGDDRIAASWVFMAGYLATWLIFSIAAAALQQLLTGPAMHLEDDRLSAAVLIAAGLYQLTPLKGACLRQCQSPAQFISRHWRPGVAGALRLGMLHGAYCVGCCWMLMTLLFVGGVMNLAWVIALAILVAAEKLIPGGQWLGRAAGLGLIAWGAWALLA